MQPITLPYARQTITAEDSAAVQNALLQERVTRGPTTRAFEEALAARCGARWAVAFNSGTSALSAAYFAAEATAADQLITTPNSFIATAAPGLRLGMSTTWIDIDRTSGNMNLQLLQEVLQPMRSRGRYLIVPVHFAGIVIDMRQLDAAIRTPNALVIEDAAHAIGSTYPTGELVGSCCYSAMTTFSFHPAKTITTCEGGAVTTNDERYYHRLLLFRNNGIEREQQYLTLGREAPGYYEIHHLTGNFHLTEPQAALGLSQLSRLDQIVAKRRALVARYREQLADVGGVRLFAPEADARTAYHLMVVQLANGMRERVMRALAAQGIGSDVHYIPLYRHPAVAMEADCPEMEAYAPETLSLPLYYDLELADVDRVCEVLCEALPSKGKKVTSGVAS